jgi:hypothetical protein
MAVSEVTVKVALTELKLTDVAPVKPVPLMVMLVPNGPLVGVRPVIVGAVVPPAVSPPCHPERVNPCVYASIPTSPEG